EHLPLAAPQLPRQLPLALREPGKQRVRSIEAAPRLRRAVRQVRACEQILLHRQLAERPPPLRAVDQAALADLMRRQALDALSREPHLALEDDVAVCAALHPLLEADQPGDGAHQRRLAGAVRSDEAHELALLDAQRHAVEDRRLVVADGEVFHLKERHARTPGTLPPLSGSSRSPPVRRRPAPRRGPSRSLGRRWTSALSACARSSPRRALLNATVRSGRLCAAV